MSIFLFRNWEENMKKLIASLHLWAPQEILAPQNTMFVWELDDFVIWTSQNTNTVVVSWIFPLRFLILSEFQNPVFQETGPYCQLLLILSLICSMRYSCFLPPLAECSLGSQCRLEWRLPFSLHVTVSWIFLPKSRRENIGLCLIWAMGTTVAAQIELSLALITISSPSLSMGFILAQLFLRPSGFTVVSLACSLGLFV